VASEVELGRLVTLGGAALTWSRPISLYYRADSPPGPPGLSLARALHNAAARL